MNKPFKIRPAGREDARIVGRLVFALLHELAPEQVTLDQEDSVIETSERLIGIHPGIFAFLAVSQGGEPLGVATLNECAAIYAGGAFGEIAELYVLPEHRSSKVGEALIDRVKAFSRERGWFRLEVCAPDQPRWKRTVDFYLGCGFIQGGPRLKFRL